VENPVPSRTAVGDPTQKEMNPSVDQLKVSEAEQSSPARPDGSDKK
jgi:hypothetical protein